MILGFYSNALCSLSLDAAPTPFPSLVLLDPQLPAAPKFPETSNQHPPAGQGQSGLGPCLGPAKSLEVLQSQESLPAPPHREILQGHKECFNLWFPAPSTPCPCRGKGSVMDSLFKCGMTAVLPPTLIPPGAPALPFALHGIKSLPRAANPQGVVGGSQSHAGGPGSP